MKVPEMLLIPERAAVLANAPSSLKLLVRIVPPAAQVEVQRPPLNLALVIDRSGSMTGPKLALAQDAACNLVSNLTPRDRVSIVAFDTEVTCVASSAPVTDVASLHRAIRSIHTAGQTALHAGWVEGGLQVSHHLGKEGISRVILLTDGQANVGESDPDVLSSHTAKLSERGVSTTTMGIGDDYDETLLAAMARGGDGNFYHIESSAQFEQFFALELMGLANLVGSQVRLELTLGSAIDVKVLNKLDRVAESSGSGPSVLSKLLGRSSGKSSSQQLILPNLISEVPIEISMTVELPRMAKSSAVDVVYLRLNYLDSQQQQQKVKSALVLPAVSAGELANYEIEEEVAEKAILMEIAVLKLEANAAIRQHDFERAKLCLQQARTLASEASPSAEMQAELQDLDYIQAFADKGLFASVSKHAYYQSHQRSQSQTSFSSGRDSRDS